MQCLASYIRGLCLECAVIGTALLLFTMAAAAETVRPTLQEDFLLMVDQGLFVAIGISLFGGLVGIIGRLRDPEWVEKSKTGGTVLAILGEMLFSVFTGFLILVHGSDYDLSNYSIMAMILVGSWLGTKAGRLILAYVKANREKLGGIIAGGSNDSTKN